MVDGRRGVIEDGVRLREGLADLSVSGVGTSVSGYGMTLGQSVPNPAQHEVEIRYALVNGGSVDLSLYDEQGRLVRLLDAGERGSGAQVVRVDVSDLSSGRYFYRLRVDGKALSRWLQVVR